MRKFLFLVLCTFIGAFSFAQSYPVSTSRSTALEYISNVQFGTINNTSVGGSGYDDYTAQTAVMIPGSTYSLSVTIDPGSDNYITAWLDWNDDGDFTDDGEAYIIATNVVTSGPFSKSITIPASAAGKMTRMRVTLTCSEVPVSDNSSFARGEVEDYSIFIDTDTDGDGVFDTEDLDADNDGILDTDENTCISQGFVNGNFENNLVNPNDKDYIQTVASDIPGWETTDNKGKIEIWADLFQGVPAFEGSYFAEINATSDGSLYQILDVNPGDIVKWKVAHRGRSGVDSMNIMVGPIGSPNIVQKVGTGTSGWVVYDSSYIVPDVTQIKIAFDAIGGGSVGNFVDDIQLYIISTDYCDSDNDGVANIYDLDSDNDGIADVVEAGGTDTDNDGRYDDGTPFVDIDGNGVHDYLDANPLSELDTDGDGFVNLHDIDSDGDGVVDNIEGQTSVGYTSPSGADVNKNGWDDSYDGNESGSQIILCNSDNDAIPDYLDDNSDNDGPIDAIEAYDTDKDDKANTVARTYDSDGDGLDDSFDVDGTSLTDNGGPTNGQSYASFPNDDNSTSPERDWREPLGTLPVELISFDAIKNNNTVDLSWTTASEINNDYFLVQKSSDNSNFETIESVDGNGNSNVVINYNAIDNNPNYGVNYYRLLQVDYDGTEALSNTVAVNFDADNNINVYPNPTKGIVNVEGARNFQLMLYTPSSNLLFSTKIENTDLYKLDLSNYPKGVYIIHLISDSKTEVKRVIVQ